MAGDVGRNERLIVLGEAAPVAGERTSVVAREAGAGTIHQYGERVLVVDVPVQVEEAVSEEVAVAPSPGHLVVSADALSSDEIGDLDEQEALGLAAFKLRASEGYVAVKAARPHAEEPWEHPDSDVEPPDILALDEQIAANAVVAEEGLADAASATSNRLTGSVAVGVVIVQGPTAALKLTQQECTKVVAEVQNGLAWLGTQSTPGGIRWVYDLRVITINARPQSSDDTSEKKEARFRDPALAAMGYGKGISGALAYVNALRKSKGTNWAYCAFFTKYPVGHFAYARLGGPRLVMHYDNDGWGPDNIDRVFAHETGHIFGAPDEYAASGCNCGGKWGHFKVANGNCVNCAPDGGVPCIMKSNTWAVCSYTPYHLGFPQGARYTGVFVAGTGGHGLWTNASWESFRQKWQQWSGQGLRLVDFDVARIGSQYRFSGVFRAGSGPYGLWAMSDWATFREKWVQWSSQGMRLVDIEVTRVGNENRYSGAFLQGSGSYGLWVNATWAGFRDKWQEWNAAGLRLVDLDVVMVNGSPRYSGVFRQGAGSYALLALADSATFLERWRQWSEQGLRLIDIEQTQVGGQTRFSGVYRQGSGAYALWRRASWTSFREKWQEWSGAGLRLVDFIMDPTGTESLAAPEPDTPALVTTGGLDGLLGFGGASLPLVSDGADAFPGEGMVDFGLAEGADDQPGDGGISPTTPAAGVPAGLAMHAYTLAAGEERRDDSPTGGGMSVGGEETGRGATAASLGGGVGEMVVANAGDDLLPSAAGIEMVGY